MRRGSDSRIDKLVEWWPAAAAARCSKKAGPALPAFGFGRIQ